MTAGGCLAAPTHYSGQGDVGTGVIHHHNTANALLAGFRTNTFLPRLLCAFVAMDTGVNGFCLCRCD